MVNEDWSDGGRGVKYSKRGFDGRCRDIELETRTRRLKLMVEIYCGICERRSGNIIGILVPR